jgi:hypothetical protein
VREEWPPLAGAIFLLGIRSACARNKPRARCVDSLAQWRANAVIRATTYAFVGGFALAWCAALAQTPPQDSASAPALELNPAQRLTIYQSISQTYKNNAAPTGFRVSVGAHVPDTIELKPVSDTLVKLIPQAKNYAIAMIEKQVVLVDPTTKQVVAVVTQEPADTAR